MSETTESLSSAEEQVLDEDQDELNSVQTSPTSSQIGNAGDSREESEEIISPDQSVVDDANEAVSQGLTEEQEAVESDIRGGEEQHPAIGGTLTRVSLGSALLAVDTLNERLETVAEAEEREVALPRTIDSVLVPVSEWEERYGESPGLATRHAAIGMMIDARSTGSRGIKLLNNIGNSTIRAMEVVLGPIINSRPFQPVRRRFDTAVVRGESQVGRWMNLGRTEDIRSRALAERTLTQAADYSMDEIVENERIQEFVQEMMAAQSLGIIDEAIEEMRERTVSSDTFFELPFRRIFRRRHRDEIPGPDIDPRIVRPASKRIQTHDEVSLLGYYAGFTSRLMALAVDVALIMVFAAVTGWLLQTIGQILGGAPRFESLAIAENIAGALAIILSSLNVVTVVVIYAFIFWTLTGQTPGMMLFGLRVVTDDGGHLSFWRSSIRLLGFVISIIFLFLGFAWVLVDDRRQGWHDKIAGTYVIYSWDAHPDETFLTYRGHLGE